MGLFGRAWSYYREHGVRSLAHRICHRRQYVVFEKRLEKEATPGEYSDVRFHRAGPEHLDLIATLDDGWERRNGRRTFTERIQGGDLAVVGVSPQDTARLLYASWISRDDPLYRLLFPNGAGVEEACSRRIWVPQSARRQGLARRGLQFAEQMAFQAGIRRLWAFVLESNGASIALHRRLGYREHGRIGVGRRLGRRFAEIRHADDRGWHRLP